MKSLFLSAVMLCCFMVTGYAQDPLPEAPPETRSEQEALREELRHMRHDLRSLDRDALRADMENLRERMRELRAELQDIEPLDGFVVDLPEALFMGPMDIDMPNIFIPDIDIPDIHIPDVDLILSEIELHDLDMLEDRPMPGLFHIGDSHNLYDDLSEAETIRLTALQSFLRGNREAQSALPEIARVLQSDDSPALRYQAVGYLGRYLVEGRAIELLGLAATQDASLPVRKRAVALLGRSKDPRAIQYLDAILKD